MMKSKLFKKISIDFFYNILAAMASSGTLQLIVYPVLASKLNADKYGALLTAVGMVNTLALALGNTLNNIRLIQNNKYEERNQVGDFSFLISILSGLSVIALAVFGALIMKFSAAEYIALGASGFLSTIRAYAVVTYRIKLDFRKNFYCNIIIAIGYGLGLILFLLGGVWTLVFLLGELSGCIYLFFSSNILKEPLKRTKLFHDTTIRYLILLVSGLSSSAMMYLDRWVLYPLIGGAAVTTYTVASFFGKSLGIILTPVAGVLLSYYASKNFKMNNRKFWKINISVLAVCLLFLVISISVSPIITRVLYPTVFNNASDYLFVANSAAIINLVVAMTQPAILKYLPTFWQIVKEFIYLTVYLALGVVLLKSYGLWGFCVATITANAVKLSVLYFIGTFYFTKQKHVI